MGKVSIMGAGEYAMRVWLRPDVLKYYGIAVGEVTAAIEKQGGIYPAGQFGAEPAPDGVAYTYTVTMPPQISTAAEFADIVVRTTSSGEQIRLGDIAEVSLGSQTYGVSSSYESDPTAMIVIYQQPGSNAVAVGGKVKAAMERLSQRFPDGVEAATIVDSTTSIDAGVKDIFRTLVIALILVIFIIFLFLQDWRATPCHVRFAFTYSLNDVAHGYGELSPCHFTVRRLCTTLPLATNIIPSSRSAASLRPISKCQAAGLLLSILNCTIGISASGYILISTPHEPWSKPQASLSSVTGTGANSSTRCCASAGEPGAG